MLLDRRHDFRVGELASAMAQRIPGTHAPEESRPTPASGQAARLKNEGVRRDIGDAVRASADAAQGLLRGFAVPSHGVSTALAGSTRNAPRAAATDADFRELHRLGGRHRQSVLLEFAHEPIDAANEVVGRRRDGDRRVERHADEIAIVDQ